MSYKRVLIKLSGESLTDAASIESVISPTKLLYIVNEIKEVIKLGVQVVIVLGGGNILRGNSSSLQLTRYKVDNMGMLSTVINSIALEDALIQNDIPAVLLSAIEMNKICEFYHADNAKKYLAENKVVICAGGIANPYFSTDTCAVMRALELNVEVVIKGTQVDGIYDKDPKKFKDAKRLKEISHKEVLDKQLKVCDMTAICLAETKNLPIIVHNIHNAGSLKELFKNPADVSIIK